MFWDAGAYATRGECDAGLGLFGERSLRDPRAPGSTPTMYQQALGTAYRGFGHVEFSGDGRHMDLCARAVNRPSRVSFEKLRPGATTLTGEVVTVNTGNVVKCLEGPRAPWDTESHQGRTRAEKNSTRIGKAWRPSEGSACRPLATLVIVHMNEDRTIWPTFRSRSQGGTYTGVHR